MGLFFCGFCLSISAADKLLINIFLCLKKVFNKGEKK